MGFEAGTHRMRAARSKSGNRKGAPIFPGAGRIECSSLLICHCKGNLPIGNGIA